MGSNTGTGFQPAFFSPCKSSRSLFPESNLYGMLRVTPVRTNWCGRLVQYCTVAAQVYHYLVHIRRSGTNDIGPGEVETLLTKTFSTEYSGRNTTISTIQGGNSEYILWGLGYLLALRIQAILAPVCEMHALTRFMQCARPLLAAIGLLCLHFTSAIPSLDIKTPPLSSSRYRSLASPGSPHLRVSSLRGGNSTGHPTTQTTTFPAPDPPPNSPMIEKFVAEMLDQTETMLNKAEGEPGGTGPEEEATQPAMEETFQTTAVPELSPDVEQMLEQEIQKIVMQEQVASEATSGIVKEQSVGAMPLEESQGK
eukprot:1059918-Rhodomonas_salina.1